jgi:hypothetical protein
MHSYNSRAFFKSLKALSLYRTIQPIYWLSQKTAVESKNTGKFIKVFNSKVMNTE